MCGEQQFSWVLNLRCQLSHSVKLLHTRLEHETGIQKGDQTRDTQLSVVDLQVVFILTGQIKAVCRWGGKRSTD